MADVTRNARFWDRAARKYAASRIGDPQGYERSVQSLRDRLRPQDRVVEFGCGTGTTALRLAPHAADISASDISSAMIAIARDKARAEGCGNLRFQVAAPETAGWPDEHFDVAVAMNVLHLIEDRGAALRAVHRALRPGGIFVSKTPCLTEMTPLIRIAVPVMQLIGKAPFVAFLSAAELEREIAGAGFQIIERARHGTRGRDIRPYLVARRQ